MRKNFSFIFRAILLGVIVPGIAFAQTTDNTDNSGGSGVDALQMMINLSNSYPALWQLVTALCYLIGFGLILKAIHYLKAYGDLRTMTSTQSSMKVPVTQIIIGSILIFAPTGFNTLNSSVFGYGSPLSYESLNSSINPMVLQAIVGLVQIVGFIAFVRGWMLLVGHAQGSAPHGSFGKALTHIIGGVLAVNIVGLGNIIWNTFGFTFQL